ncbi:MAG: hypothetical protein ACOYXA_12610 [Bacteroidota bacterium]
MKTIFSILVINLFFLNSCTADKTKVNPDAKKVVESFYTWYIGDAYSKLFDYYQVPPFKKMGDKEYIFDKNELSERLNKVDYLSDSYKRAILDKLELCNNEMRKRKWDYEPEPQFNIKQCDYLWYDNWVGGQGERINGFNIINETSNQSNIEFLVEILINNKVFTKSKVTVEKEKNSYKISNIELIWK